MMQPCKMKFDPLCLAHGNHCCIKTERKCVDFVWHLRKAQMKLCWRVGVSESEWQNVAKSTLNALRMFQETASY